MIGGPKHISGFSAVYQGKLYIVINYCTAFGFDVLGNVEDISIGGVVPTSTVYSFEKVQIEYANYTEPLGGFKKYQITFGSGYTTTIDIDVLGINREVSVLADSQLGYAKDCSENIGYLQTASGRISFNQTNVYGAYPTADPAGVFGYSNLWERQSNTELFGIESGYVSGVWASNAYTGGKADSANSGLQHVRFIAALNTSISELNQSGIGIDPFAASAGLFLDALYGTSSYAAVVVFDWAVNLRACKALTEYDVCTDPGSPSYFEVTQQDCDGHTISSEYLSGAQPANFVDCCACATDCSEVYAQLTIIPAATLNDTGSFTISVAGTANYTYELIVPSGITYTGNATPPTTALTTHTFTDVPYTSEFGIYTVKVTDSVGCFREFKVRMPDEKRTLGLGGPIEGCMIASALNYNPLAVVEDGSCIYCQPYEAGSVLISNGINLQQPINLSNSSVSNASSASTADGSIQVVGAINPIVLPYLTTPTYDIDIYPVANNGDPYTGSPIQSITGLSSVNSTFSNLFLPGWYIIVATHTGGSLCDSVTWERVGYEESEITCDVNIDWRVNPCTGAFSFRYGPTENIETVLIVDSNGTEYPENSPITVSQNETLTVNIIFTEESGCAPFYETETFGPSYFNCNETDPEPEPVIEGCMDPESSNYNPNANTSDGSCEYPGLGCTDINAANFDPTASIDDGSCVYGISGCMEPEATNYDPNATIPTGCVYACTEPIIRGIQLAGNMPTIVFINITTSYTITWVNNETGVSITTEDTTVGPYLENGVYTITVTDGNGCTETIIRGINTEIVYGCTDTNAENYSPAANTSNGDCTYSFVPSPCNPPEIDGVLTGLDKCLSDKLNTYFNLMKAGRLSLCKTKVAEVLVLLKYLLGRKGLDCVFNCADSLSPTYSETVQGESCSTKWVEGGPTGESLVWDPTIVYEWGDVVQHPTSLDIYTMTYNPSIGQYIAGSDPETVAGETYWEYCKEPLQFIDVTNRLDSYLAFVKDECKDCGIPGFTPIPSEVQENPNVPDPTTEGGARMTIDGDNIEL